MKIALAQFNPTVGDFTGNAASILSLAAQAKTRGAELAVFTELCLCGYPPQDLLERPAFIQRNREELQKLATSMPLPAIVGYASAVTNGRGKAVANTAALLRDGRVVFEQSKMLLPTYDVFDESRYFQAAERQFTFAFGAELLGITICEDAWNEAGFWPKQLYERDPVNEIVQQGSSVLINISASPYTLDKRTLRFEMLRSIALRHRRPVIYVNQFGGNDSLIFDGASLALTADGSVAAQALAFEQDLVLFDTVTGKGEDCLCLRGAGDGRPGLCAEVRIPQGLDWAERGHRFRGGGGDCRGRAGRGECFGRVHAGAVFVRGQQDGCAGGGQAPGDTVLDAADRRGFRCVPQRAGAGVWRARAGCYGREFAGAGARELFDGAVEQVWVDGAEHRE
jgi:predicted amidohydrolase